MSYQDFLKSPYAQVMMSSYYKNKYYGEVETWISIQISKLLAQDLRIVSIIRKLVDYQYYVKPKHYYYLLYFNLPKIAKPGKLSSPKKVEEKENVLMERLKEVLGWSNSEIRKNQFVFDEILKDSKEWKQKLGIK